MKTLIIISENIKTGEMLFDLEVEFKDKQIYRTPIDRINEPSKEFTQIINELKKPGN